MTFDPRRRAVTDIKTEHLLDMVVDLNRALVVAMAGLAGGLCLDPLAVPLKGRNCVERCCQVGGLGAFSPGRRHDRGCAADLAHT
jgi:hypothetical protein